MSKCIHVDCNRFASYNHPGLNTRLYCNSHKIKGMINITTVKCDYEGCKNLASYNYPDIKIKKFCVKHKSPEMVFIKSNLCIECGKSAKFGYDCKRTHCSQHKLPDMINLSVTKCKHSKCTKAPNFNYPSQLKGLYCSEHKLATMINVSSNKCESCDKIATFNYPGEKTGRCCIQHKSPEMISIYFKKCQECIKKAYYNYPGELAAYCGEHKNEHMINVNLKEGKCIYDGCNKKASYNYYYETKRLYCATHKLLNMVDINNKKCKFKGCKKRPTFNYPDKKERLFCYIHKLPNMVNVNRIICEEPECGISASYSLPDDKLPRFCSLHAKDGMSRLYKYKPTLDELSNYDVITTKYKDDYTETIEFNSSRLYNYIISSYENKNNKFVISLVNKPNQSVVVFLDSKDILFKSKNDVENKHGKPEEITPEILKEINENYLNNIVVVINLGSTKKKSGRTLDTKMYKLVLCIHRQLDLIHRNEIPPNPGQNPIKLFY